MTRPEWPAWAGRLAAKLGLPWAWPGRAREALANRWHDYGPPWRHRHFYRPVTVSKTVLTPGNRTLGIPAVPATVLVLACHCFGPDQYIYQVIPGTFTLDALTGPEKPPMPSEATALIARWRMHAATGRPELLPDLPDPPDQPTAVVRRDGSGQWPHRPDTDEPVTWDEQASHLQARTYPAWPHRPDPASPLRRRCADCGAPLVIRQVGAGHPDIWATDDVIPVADGVDRAECAVRAAGEAAHPGSG